MWAGMFCPAKDKSCGVDWIEDADVYAAWKLAVSGGIVIPQDDADDSPPF